MATVTTRILLFNLGQKLATHGALDALAEAGLPPTVLLRRHQTGDWGELDDHDKLANARALVDGSRILSAYHLKTGTRIWVITDAADDIGHRASTTVLLPSEY